MPQIAKLYYAPALANHWVAEDTNGALWLLPVSPLSPRAWEARRPYHGNYELTLVVPQSLKDHYQPQSAHKILRVGEAARRAGCSDVTIRTAADRGDLPVASYIGKRRERRFRREDVDAWMAGKRGDDQ